jgi:hypothetical protein
VERNDIYEPPQLVEVGEFAEETKGSPRGSWPDNDILYPWYGAGAAQG